MVEGHLMRKILFGLLLVPCLAFAAGDDLLINQRNTADTATISRVVAHPVGVNGLLGYSNVTGLPVFFTYGPSLTLTAGVLNAVPSDWSTVTGKPSFAPVATSGTYSSLTGVPTTFPPSAHSQAWSTITAIPTTLAGYGISDGATLTQLATKFNTPAGTALQYVRGDGTLATLPVAKRIETYAGTTNASGQISVTYPTAFAAVPVVQPPAPAAANQVWTTVSSTTTGFTLQLNQRNVVTLLSIEVLLGATVPVVGTAATVLVVAQ